MWTAQTAQDGVLVVDGYGVRLAVDRGHLIVADGLCEHRRLRRFARPTAGLKRLVVLGHSGAITLEALRWLHDRKAAFVQLDADARVVAAFAPPGRDDARLRRAQAVASTSSTGVELARWLIGEKVRGQTAVLARLPAAPAARIALTRAQERLAQAQTLQEVAQAESLAAAAYWAAWADVPVRFVRAEERRIPEHWRRVGSRSSPLTGSPRLAANPANALLNYLYAILEAEARIACLAVGLDPGVGILHADQPARDSLALDMMEAVRPKVDAYVLDLLQGKVFRAADFFETREGVCRVLPPLTCALAQLHPACARWVVPVAEQVARMLARCSPHGPFSPPTPLTQTNRRAGRDPLRRRQPRAPRVGPLAYAVCRRCGTLLEVPSRALCSACLPAARTAQIVTAGLAEFRRRQITGRDPSHGGVAARRRADQVRRWQQEVRAWEAANPRPQPKVFRREILPALRRVPVRTIAQAAGISLRYASLIRQGLRVPHQRCWEALRKVGTTARPSPDAALYCRR